MKTGKAKEKPMIVADYNEHVGDVELKDQPFEWKENICVSGIQNCSGDF
jgi:hypothetical protein